MFTKNRSVLLEIEENLKIITNQLTVNAEKIGKKYDGKKIHYLRRSLVDDSDCCNMIF